MSSGIASNGWCQGGIGEKARRDLRNLKGLGACGFIESEADMILVETSLDSNNFFADSTSLDHVRCHSTCQLGHV